MSVPSKVEEYVSALDQALQDLPEHDATAKWNAMKDAIYSTAMYTFGKNERPSQDWFNGHLSKMEPVN